MDVIVNACKLRSFLEEMSSDKKERQLRYQALAYIPKACNYKYHRERLSTQVVGFHSTTKTLLLHFQLRLSSNCEFLLTALYYESLKRLRDTQSQILGCPRLRPPIRNPEDDNKFIRMLFKLRLL